MVHRPPPHAPPLPQEIESPSARALDHADSPSVQGLEQPLREAARELGGIGKAATTATESISSFMLR